MSVFDGVVLGKHTLSSGKESNVKFVIERMLENATDRFYVTQLLKENKRCNSSYAAVAGLETGGALCGLLLASVEQKSFFTLDKDYVPSRLPFYANEEVLLVDDVVSTGASVQKGMAALVKAGFKCVEYTCAIDRREMGDG
jgi:orotate phosphoribosyltransferase